MNITQKVALAATAIFFSLIVIIGGMYFTYSNREITLAAQVSTKQEANKAQYDTMWKVISQKAQITEEYKTSFKDIYTAIMEGRYGDERGGSLMSWIQESNPNFDVSLYKDLMVSVEGQREKFLRDQKELIDLNREHDLVITTFPGSLFVGDRPMIEITVVTSAKTDADFATGQDNDVDVFQKKQ